MMKRFREFILFTAFFGDSLVHNAFPNRDKPKDQIFCILIQAIFGFLVSIPLTILAFPVLLLLFSQSEMLFFAGLKDIYFFISLTLMVPIVLNLYNKEFSFPKSLLNVYYLFKTNPIKPFRVFTLLGMFCLIVYSLFSISFNFLSSIAFLKESYLLFGYAVFTLVLLLLFLESTSDDLSRALRQFSFWLIIFLLFLGFSFTQLNLYIIPDLNNENALNVVLILIGVLFNFAQVLSSGRVAYLLAIKKLDNEGVIDNAYKEAFTYSKLLAIIEEYKHTQTVLIAEIKKEVGEIGVKNILIRMIPFFLIVLVTVPIFTLIQLNLEKIESFTQYVIDFLVEIWVYLLGGDETFALYVFLLMVSLYFFFYKLIEMIANLKSQNPLIILTQLNGLLFILCFVALCIGTLFNNQYILLLSVMSTFILTVIISIIKVLIQKFSKKNDMRG